MPEPTLGRGTATGARRPFAARLALAVLLLPVAGIALADATSNVVVEVDPAKAHAIAPWSGVATAAFAEQEMALNPSGSLDRGPAPLAALALRQDGTAVSALNVLGMTAQAGNRPDDARKVFAHALTLSRRDLPARIWAIEEAVGRGDIAEALANYDIALRTSRAAKDLLFPILGTAIAEPLVRQQLLKVLARDPVWERPFVAYAAASGGDPVATYALFRAGRALPIDEVDRSNLVDGLFSRGKIADAWSFFASFREGASRERSRDPRFAANYATPTKFDWRIVDTPGVTASLQASGADGMLDFFISPSASGPMAEQVQFLPAGRYQLRTRSAQTPPGQADATSTRPYWKITCNDGRELARLALPASEGEATTSFTVPPACSWQTLQFMARSESSSTGSQGGVLFAAIMPVGAGRE